MYRAYIVIVLLLTAVIIILHRLKTKEVKPVNAGTMDSPGKGRPVRKLINLVAVICFLVLALTGFWPNLFSQGPMHGLSLMVHVTVGAVLAVLLAAVTCMYAYTNRFDSTDWQTLGGACPFSDTKLPPGGCSILCRKICFWVMAFLAVVVIMSIALSMLPLYGSDGQRFLMNTHRYATVLLIMSAGLFGYLTLASKAKSK